MYRIDFTRAAGVCRCVAVGLLLSGSGVSCVLSTFLRNANEYTCLDEHWIESCAIGYGSVFSGTRYRQSATGQSCIGGTSCAFDEDDERIKCQISDMSGPHYEDCMIPLCSDTPLCDSTLESLDTMTFSNGVATVSTTEQLVAAMRNHKVSEIVLTQHLEVSDSDANGIPVILRPGRELVLNRQGNANIYARHQGILRTMFVNSGANMVLHRAVYVGDLFDTLVINLERNGTFTVVDAEVVFDSCVMISAYSQTLRAMQTLSDTGATMSGNTQDRSLVLKLNSTDWVPSYDVIYRKDDDSMFGGWMRFINSRFHCNGTKVQPLQSSSLQQNLSLSADEPAGMDTPPDSKSAGSSLLFTIAGTCCALVILILAFAAYQYNLCATAFCRTRTPLILDNQEPASETEQVGSSSTMEPEEYDNWVQRRDKLIDSSEIHGSARMCQTISEVKVKVNEMVMHRSSTRIRGVDDFEMVGSMTSVNMNEGAQRDQSAATEFATCKDDFEDKCQQNSTGNMQQAQPPNTRASQALRAGVVVNGYAYVQLLGSGAQGEVFLVQEQATGEKLTMKVPKRSNVQAVVQEAYLLAMLDHPNIVAHKETFVSNGQLIVVTEWCKHGDLYSIMKQSNHAPFLEPFIRSLLFQLAFGISHMHSRGVAHRDIKPANIFITDRGVVKLGDLGSGRVLLDTTDTFTGTPLFMAPEIIAGEAYTKECDVYSLGLVLYVLCTGKAAYISASSLHDLQDFKLEGIDLSGLRGKYSDDLVDAMNMMMLPEACRPTALDIMRWDWPRQLPVCGPDSKASSLDLTLVICSEVSSRLNAES